MIFQEEIIQQVHGEIGEEGQDKNPIHCREEEEEENGK
jgi:hypothetical protein